MRSDIKIENNI